MYIVLRLSVIHFDSTLFLLRDSGMNILYTLVPHRIKPNIKKAMFTSNGGPKLLLMDQAKTLPPMVGARVLKN